MAEKSVISVLNPQNWELYNPNRPHDSARYSDSLSPIGFVVKGPRTEIEKDLFSISNNATGHKYNSSRGCYELEDREQPGVIYIPKIYNSLSRETDIIIIRNYLWRLSYKIVLRDNGLMMDPRLFRADPHGNLMIWVCFTTDSEVKEDRHYITTIDPALRGESVQFTSNLQLVSDKYFNHPSPKNRRRFSDEVQPVLVEESISSAYGLVDLWFDFHDRMDTEGVHKGGHPQLAPGFERM